MKNFDFVKYDIQKKGWKYNYFSVYIVKNNIKSADLAKKLGITPQNLSNWLHQDEENLSDSVKCLIRCLKGEVCLNG